jgi:hypothetical protein
MGYSVLFWYMHPKCNEKGSWTRPSLQTFIIPVLNLEQFCYPAPVGGIWSHFALSGFAGISDEDRLGLLMNILSVTGQPPTEQSHPKCTQDWGWEALIQPVLSSPHPTQPQALIQAAWLPHRLTGEPAPLPVWGWARMVKDHKFWTQSRVELSPDTCSVWSLLK